MSFHGSASEAPPVRRACDLLLASLVLPPLLLHALKYLLVLVFPLGDVSTMRALLGWSMPIAYLFVATPLSLLAVPGAFRLVRALPEPPLFALSLRAAAVLFGALTAGATAARFTSEMGAAAALQDAAGLAKLALGAAAAAGLLTGQARAPRPLLLGAALVFSGALVMQTERVFLGNLSPRLMVLVRGSAAGLLAASLLLARRGGAQAAR